MWTMEKRRQDSPPSGESEARRKKSIKVIEVQTMRLEKFVRKAVKGGGCLLTGRSCPTWFFGIQIRPNIKGQGGILADQP